MEVINKKVTRALSSFGSNSTYVVVGYKFPSLLSIIVYTFLSIIG
jgi:hypothetical protein